MKPQDKEDKVPIQTELQTMKNNSNNTNNSSDKKEETPLKLQDQPMNGNTDQPLNIDHDIDKEEEEEAIDFKGTGNEVKKKLLFEQKNISAFRLYCHLSEKLDILLMILGIIGSLGSGVAYPLIAFLAGDMTTKLIPLQDPARMASCGTPDASLSEDELAMWFLECNKDEFWDIVDDMVNKFLYIGTGMFFAFFLMTSMWTYSGLRQMHKLKEKYFATILQQEQGWFDANNAFEFATKVQAQIEQVELGVGEKFGQLLQMIAQLISGLVIALTTSWELTLIMICVAPLILLAVLILVTALKKGIILSRKTYEKAGGIAEEVLYNIKTVASFANFDFETKRFNSYVDRVEALDADTGMKLGACLGAMIFFIYCCFVVAILYARRMMSKKADDKDGIQSGDVMTVMFSTLMAIMSIGSIGPNIKTIQEACIASSDYFTLVERKPQIDVSQATKKPPRDDVKGKIEFRNIKFIYPSDENKRVILDGLNLLFEPGKKVALVGESGCGKSTTVNLIERLYDPVDGDVFIDDINIKEYDITYLRSLIGYVQQEPVLFNKSIRENLIFGREDAIKELGDVDTLIKEACEEAYASEFINKMPEKFNYTVGIKGSKLSGGQKQRIAIARAILCKPKILILDEATSALDNKSEKEVQRALDQISQKNVTTVIIAHRLSTIKNADLIYAIKEGKVLEQGTHKELLDKNGYYAGLVRSQLAQDELESKESNIAPALERKKSSVMERMNSKRQSSHIVDGNVEINQMETHKKVKVERGRLFKILHNNKLDMVLGTIGSALTGALNPATGFVMAMSINSLSKSVEEEKTRDEMRDDSLFYAMMYLVVAVANGFCMFLKIWRFSNIAVKITSTLRKQVVEKYLHLHVGYFDLPENAPGGLLTKLSIDTTQLNSIVFSIMGDVVNVTCNAIVGLVLGFYFSWRLTLITICFIPFIVFANVIRNQTQHKGRDKDKKINVEAGSVLSECVVNTKTIYSFNFQKPAVDMYLGILEEAKTDFTKDSIWNGIFMGIGTFAQFCCNATLFHYSVYFIFKGKLKFEDMNRVMNILIVTASGIGNGLSSVGDAKKASNAFKSLFSTIDTECLIDITEEGNRHKKSAQDIKGKIEFKNVTFSYPTRRDQKILKNVSFVIQPGQAAALVGYSGCGKSTIIELLERYYDPDEGEILIDDVNIKDYNLIELRRKIGLVSQEPVLFKRSVYNNILYGNLSATKEDVLEAARKACIMKFFTKNDAGKKEDPVSGGEKQRLAIGRAFLKNPVILLLDEATSALDKESEIEVQKSIYELQKQRTSVSVAHRLSTIEGSDIIFVLEAGKIVEKGTHQELMNLQGKYYVLHKYSDAA